MVRNNKKLTEMITDYRWVIDVLRSSETKDHLFTSDKLFFMIFLNKWKILDGIIKDKLIETYNKNKFVVKHSKNIKR
jgi:hypothetical protein